MTTCTELKTVPQRVKASATVYRAHDTIWRRFMWQACNYYNMLPCEELSCMCRLASGSFVCFYWYFEYR